ncbi:MAG: hypothetical protein K2H04_07510 [Bacteroidaceae bacterium]|nr:hypothetical protein [Bacteroidaceae bacterium]
MSRTSLRYGILEADNKLPGCRACYPSIPRSGQGDFPTDWRHDRATNHNPSESTPKSMSPTPIGRSRGHRSVGVGDSDLEGK